MDGDNLIKIDPNKSIFMQLADHIRFEIYSGKRHSGSKIESIRDMALKLEVNPNTIKKVYKVLQDEGLIYTNSTLGYFVNEDDDLINRNRDRYINNKLEEFLNILKECNLNEKDIIKYMKGSN